MDTAVQAAALLALILGTAFSLVGVLGFFRMPDVYTRLHPTGKVSIFGVVLLLVAAIALTPLKLGKGLVLIGLVTLAGPVVAHAISSAAYCLGIPLRHAVRNDLEHFEPACRPDVTLTEKDGAGSPLGAGGK